MGDLDSCTLTSGGDDSLATENRVLIEEIGRSIVDRISLWLSEHDNEEAVVNDFSENADWGTQFLREDGTKITPQYINHDGTLQAHFPDGSTKTLVADYLW